MSNFQERCELILKVTKNQSFTIDLEDTYFNILGKYEILGKCLNFLEL